MALPKHWSRQAPELPLAVEAVSPRAIERVPVLVSLAFGVLALVAISVLTHGVRPQSTEPAPRALISLPAQP